MHICKIDDRHQRHARADARDRAGAQASRCSTCWRTTPSSLPERDGRSAPPGPYRLTLAIREKRLVFDVDTEAGDDAAEFHLSLSPFRQVVKDYWQICESYYDAVKNLPPSKIEAIDMARRGIHNEGARILEERLEGKAEVDNRHGAAAFHPDLRPAFRGLRGQVTQDFPQSVLFCCDHNSTRSPMAEGLMKKFYGHRAYVQSAGSFDTMGPLGDDPASFDLVVALSPAAHGRVCAMAANHAFDVEFWPIDDPTRAGERRDERLAAFRAARDQIAARLRARFGPPNEDAAHAG
jgi:protein-tyrosine-phosphatase